MTLNAVCGDLLVDKISLSVELIYAEEDNIQGGHLYHEKNLVRVWMDPWIFNDFVFL